MSVSTRACSFSASAMRAFHAASLLELRPARITGFFALERSVAASSTVFGEGTVAGGDLNLDTSGTAGSGPTLDSWSAASRLTYVGPRGAVSAIWTARSNASYAAATEAGWLSHFV